MRSIFFSLLFFCHGPLVRAEIFTYRPAIVELTGTLELQTFPGPPNYESIQHGDEIETHFYLRLKNPIEVKPTGKHQDVDNPEPETNVKILQMTIGTQDSGVWSKIQNLGKEAKVTVRGKLFHRFTGHHHARVLIGIDSIKGKE